ncbi:MAG: transposase [Deltaproteobacteria bacterium]|nr:transposase [Deltaproteobacteria bacterium]MBW2007595.1 transposase [Deltaproteobacteria bacterium]
MEVYERRLGFCPESVHADRIYRTRENLRCCKERHIRLWRPRLGRQPNVTRENENRLRMQALEARQDELDRIAIEEMFARGNVISALGAS